MNLIKLTQKLISIPSFVDKNTDEKKIGDFLYDYLKDFNYLDVEKQEVENRRFNIVAKDKEQPELLFLCHMDTTEPKAGWDYSQGELKENKLYGLGSYDMKGGTACLLDALKDFSETKGLALLFYCDEEYDFKGMKKFLEQYSFNPKLIISPEPTNLEIINGCKGVIEIYFKIKGKTGHAARPEEGINSIDGVTNIVSCVREELKKYQDSPLGKSTLNLAYLSGGLAKDSTLGDRGNNIPDTAGAVLDIRTNNKELNAQRITKIIKESAGEQKLIVEEVKIRSDYGSIYTPKEKLVELESILENVNYGDIEKQGYFDGEMISSKSSSPFVCFGPKGNNAHGVNEWVDVESLNKTRNIYKNLIEKFCT